MCKILYSYISINDFQNIWITNIEIQVYLKYY